MKKGFNIHLLIAVLVLCFANTVHLFAQEKETAKQGEEYGVKAGINFAELWGKDALPESDRKVGYSFGGYASYKISESLKIQPEVIWSLQGQSSEESGRYKISYVNIPVMLKWSEGKFYYELGPQLGGLTINTAKSVPDELKLENFETFDFSLNAGLGYKLAEEWAIGIRYCQGLTNIVSARDLKNSVLYLGLAYRIF
jgi:hypothetical protein